MKQCAACEQVKSEEEFSFRDKSRGTRASYCKSCKKEMDRKDWESGRRKSRNYQSKNRSRERNREIVWSVLTSSKCMDCGEDDPRVLEFDHIKDKVEDIAYMVHRYRTVKALKEEMSKCEIVCANCHKIRTDTRANNWRQVRWAVWERRRVEASE